MGSGLHNSFFGQVVAGAARILLSPEERWSVRLTAPVGTNGNVVENARTCDPATAAANLTRLGTSGSALKTKNAREAAVGRGDLRLGEGWVGQEA